MARVLLGWELGGGLGHVANLLPLAHELARLGHEPVFALRDVSEPWPLLSATGYRIFQSPWLRDRPQLTGSRPFRARSYADILAYNGFDAPAALQSLVSAWDRLLEAIDPELVVIEHAPALCLACYGRYPTVGIGTGFTVPPLDGEHFPVLNPEAPELVPAARVAATILGVLDNRGLPAPVPLFAAALPDESIPLCFDVLDPYRASRREPAAGPLSVPGGPIEPAASATCLVYLPADHPQLETILSSLREARIEGIAYVPSATETVLDWLRATRLAISTVPLDLSCRLPRVGAVLHHGGSGLAHLCLAAARPQVLAPIFLEQGLTASALQELGVAIRIGGAVAAPQAGAALRRVFDTPRFSASATRIARELRERFPRGSLERVAAACQSRMAPHAYRRPPRVSPEPVHIVHSFENVHGGSEQRAVGLFSVLRDHGAVRLWSEFEPHPELAARYPIRRIGRGDFPRAGTLVFVSTYYPVGAWLEQARPERIVMICNVDAPQALARWVTRLARSWLPPPEWLFASAALRSRCRISGDVQLSPIDLDRFAAKRDYRRVGRGEFVVGRLSRDVPEKHHPDDPVLYRELAARGYRVRIMGGTVLRAALAGVAGIELLPEGAEPAEEFLRSLDAFLYRTGPGWFESFGRVVAEAMASGLPVVLHRRGGNVEEIDPDRTGFLFDSNAEAIATVERLRADPARCQAIGEAAAAHVRNRYGHAYVAALRDYYLGRRGSHERREPLSAAAAAPSVAKTITVFFGADEAFAAPLAVALESLLANNRGRRFAVHIAATGLDPALQRKLAAIASRYGATAWLHAVSGEALDGLPTGERISSASYFRLLMPRLIPLDVARVLYLDCDVVVAADIGELWRTDLGEALVAAVADLGADRTRRTALGLPPEHRYVNSGVLLANLEAWRREGFAEQVLAFPRRFPHRIEYHDQDALNACLRGRVRYLPCTWNYMPYLSATRENAEHARIEAGEIFPAIVHFAGARKPWREAINDRWSALYREFGVRSGFTAGGATGTRPAA